MHIHGGKYTTFEPIGHGKFGIVYRGMNTRTNTDVAIKIETTDVLLLKREATILRYLYERGCEKYVPTVYWYGLYDNAQCLVMTYYYKNIIDESSLHTNIIMQQCIDALRVIHELNIVHRDIKPENFMLTTDNCVNIIDFGLSIFINTNTTINDDSNQQRMVGTPRYTSIYIHEGQPYIFRDDLISLGYVYMFLSNMGVFWYGNISIPQIMEYKKWENISKSLSEDTPIRQYLEYCYKLSPIQSIDYNYLINLFEN